MQNNLLSHLGGGLDPTGGFTETNMRAPVTSRLTPIRIGLKTGAFDPRLYVGMATSGKLSGRRRIARASLSSLPPT